MTNSNKGRRWMTIDLTEERAQQSQPTRLLLLDDDPATLMLRATILRKHGYECITAATYEAAVELFDLIDIAVLDYHLGTGKFGSDVAVLLRKSRPEVSIIILSSTLEHYFGGAEDMHLLKGYSSNENLIAALQSIDAKRHGTPVIAEARQFFYSRLCHSIGDDVLIQVFDDKGLWVYCNEAAAEYLGRDRDWFPGRSVHAQMPQVLRNWQKIVLEVLDRHETYIDRSRQGLLNFPDPVSIDGSWSILAFPIALHDGDRGVILAARMLTPPLSS
jgi:two-component system OmpR family response regulator